MLRITMGRVAARARFAGRAALAVAVVLLVGGSRSSTAGSPIRPPAGSGSGGVPALVGVAFDPVALAKPPGGAGEVSAEVPSFVVQRFASHGGRIPATRHATCGVGLHPDKHARGPPAAAS